MARDMAEAEAALGLNSRILLTDSPTQENWGEGADADVHVLHSHIPDSYMFAKKRGKIVSIMHGTPEHCFESSVYEGMKGQYAPADAMALSIFFCKSSDAVVTFWPRHAYLWETMTDKPVFVVPMGVDKAFWKPLEEKPVKLAGFPAIFTGENMHNIKWPLDMMFLWPHLREEFPNSRLHIIHLPHDQHRYWFALATANGASYTANMTAIMLQKPELRNFGNACDFYLSPVRYGDFNRMCLEMKTCGARVISFAGNPYADFWLTEGDQRRQTEELIRIFKGEVNPLPTEEVPDIRDTALAMCEIYRRLCDSRNSENLATE